MAEENKKELDQETEQDTSGQELDELTVMQDVEEQEISAQKTDGEEASAPTDETPSRVATKEIKFEPRQEQEVETDETPLAQRLDQIQDAEEATDPELIDAAIDQINLGLGDVNVASIEELEDVLARGVEGREDPPLPQGGAREEAEGAADEAREAASGDTESDSSDTTTEATTDREIATADEPQTEEQLSTFRGEDTNTDTSFDNSDNTDTGTTEPTDPPVDPEPPVDPTPQPLATNLNVRLSNATANQRDINSTDGYDLTTTEFGKEEVLTGADLDIAGVPDNAEVTYTFTDENTVEVTLDSNWNSVKNIEVTSDDAGNVTVNNFVHADINLGGTEPSQVTVNGAKRGNITTAGNDDVVDVNSFTNNSGWSNEIDVSTNAGNDTITLTGDKGITEFVVDAGADNDNVTIDGDYYGSQVHLGEGDDTFTGGASGDVVHVGSGFDTITGGGDQDTFVIQQSDGHTLIKDFGGVGGGGRGEAALLPEHDLLKLSGEGLTAENMLLSYENGNTVITFEGVDNFSITLENFDFTDLDNLPANSSFNIFFDGQTEGTDAYDVFNDHSANQNNIWNSDSVTFLNNADNTVSGKDNSDDVINAMAGDDVISGRGGDDLIRGQEGDDILKGGSGDDILKGGSGDDVLKGGRDNDDLRGNSGDDILKGGSGDDTLRGGKGDDRLVGGKGDDELRGGSGNDDLRGNAGDDVIKGGRGDDTLRGGQGDDVLKGGSGDDVLKAGKGDDILKGGSGDDILIGGNEAAVTEIFDHEYEDGTPEFPDVSGGRIDMSDMNGLDSSNTTFDHAHDVSINFISEGAGYKNMLGTYTVDEEGNIVDVQIIEVNASASGSGGTLSPGDVIADMGELAAGTQIQFFTVANGYNRNNFRNENGNDFIDLAEGSLSFLNSDGDPANAGDDSALELVFTPNDGGDPITIDGPSYHSTGANLNPDGKEHVASGINANGNLQIGFEDLPNLGDADFNDLIIEMEVSPAEVTTVPEGEDVAVFTGDRSEYNITENNNGSFTIEDTVAGRDGTDTVSQVETFRFNDGDIDEADLLSSFSDEAAPSDDPAAIIDENQDDADEVSDDNDELLADDGNNGPQTFGLDNMDDDNFESEDAWTAQLEPQDNDAMHLSEDDDGDELENELDDVPVADPDENENSNNPFEGGNNEGFGF